jgi:tape measure domain-containing protein
MADILASVSVVLGAEISGFRAAMADARRELRGLVQFSEGLKDIGSNLTAAVSVPIALLGTASVVASAKLETLKNGLTAISAQELNAQGVTGLSAMGLAADMTGKRIAELQQIAKRPGLGLEGAEQADVRLRAVGISAEQSAKSIAAFANAIATTGGGKNEFDRVTVQLAQLSAKGKVLSQDLRPIIEAAPAVSQALLKLYGTIDSETISASLTKQGQSSKDFIAVLTDELAKLPQVTGGLKAIYENDLDALLVSSAKVGDGIANALDLKGLGEKLGEEITAIGDSFAALSPGAQVAIVSFAGLVAATGPVLVAIGTLGAALPAIKAGFAALGTATTAVGETLTLLTGPVGLAVVALAALAAGLYYVATASDRALASYQEQAKETNRLTSSINPLLARYNELSAKTSLTTIEQEELASVIKQLAATVPGATTAIDEYGNATGISTQAVGEFVQALQAQKAAQAALNLPAASQKLDELSTNYQVLKKQADEFNKTGSIKVDVLDAGGGSVEVYKAGSQAVIKLQADLATANVEFLKQKQLVDELKNSTAGLAETDESLAGALQSVGLGVGRTAGLLAELRERLKEVREQRENETTVAAITADNARIKSLEEQIKKLEGVDKTGNKAAEAIAKLRRELAALTALDDILARPADGVDTVNRRVQALESGLKRLLEAGVSPNAKAFKAFAAEALTLQQGLAKLQASTELDFKVLTRVKVAPVTIGEMYPNLVGTISKELADRPLAVPFQLVPLRGVDVFPVTEQIKAGFQEAATSSEAFGASFDYLGARADVLKSGLQTLISQGISPTSPVLQKLAADYRATAEAAFVNLSASKALQQGILELASGVSSAFGEAISGASSIGAALGQLVLSTIGKVAMQLGEILLAAGLGIEALKVSLSTFHGAGAVIAGLGLIAIGGFASAAASNLSKSGSVGAGAASSPIPRNYGQNSSPQRVEVVAELKLRGPDLAAVLRGDTYRVKLTG